MRLGLKIAVRFLKSAKGQTIMIILGIAIGVSVQVFIGSLIQGLQKGLIDKTIGNSSQITITSMLPDRSIPDYRKVMEKAAASDSRITAVSPVLDGSVLLQSGSESQSLLVRGVEPERADGIYDFSGNLESGKLPSQDFEIILGSDLKEEYGFNLNQTVSITTSTKETFVCKIVGFFDLGVASINKSWGIVTLKSAQNIFGTGDRITSIEMQVNDKSIFLADTIAAGVENQINDDRIKTDNWKAQNEQLLSGLQGQSISSYMIQIFVLVSVVLGIASVLAITVLQKSKQIGILKAMGIKNSSTAYVFLFEGLILGIFGAVMGILLGLGLSFSFTKFALNPDGTPVINLFIDPAFITVSGAIAVAASVIAALIPAIRSSRLNPIDIIRNN